MKDINRNAVSGYVILSFLFFFIVWGIEKGIDKQELEQKLCELKKYEYCSKEQLLKTIK